MRRTSGFTLLEMMIALAMTGIVAVSILAAMQAQLASTYQQGRVGEAQQMARVALENLIPSVQLAGFGVPGSFAFTTGTISTAEDNSTTAGLNSTCPGTDVLEIRSRDPRGFWGLGAATTNLLTLQNFQLDGTAIVAPQDLAWPKGAWVMGYAAPPAQTVLLHTAGRLSGALTASVVAADTLPVANAIATAAASSEIDLVKIARFRVSCFDPAHPVLQYEDDTDTNGDGVVNAADITPVASDIEDFQVAYLVDTDQDGLVTDADAVPLPAESPTKATTMTQIKAIRITVVARSSEIQGNGTLNQPPSIENHNRASQPADRYVRRVLRDTIILRNRDTSNPSRYIHVSNYWM